MYQCPFCDHTEPEVQAVEAHITGSTNSYHKGKVGKTYRREIEESGEPDSLRERLTKPDSKTQARISDIEKLRDENEALKDAVVELAERVHDLEEQAEKHNNRIRQNEGNLKKLNKRIDGTEYAIRRIHRAFGTKHSGFTCPNCQTKVKNNTVGELECPNCGADGFRGALKRVSLE